MFKLQQASFGFFLIFNFINRDISNIFLLITLLLCVINFDALKELLKSHKKLIFLILTFTTIIITSAILNNSRISEIDNYTRLLLLTPLLAISYNDKYYKLIILAASVSAAVTLIYTTSQYNYERYWGTSSHPITYANICALMSMVSLYRMFMASNKYDSIIYGLSFLFFIVPMFMTATRGPLIGIIICIALIIALTKSYKLFISTLVILFLVTFTSNSLSTRLSRMVDINLFDIEANGHVSIRERVAYLHYGVLKSTDNILIGIGPSTLEPDMKKWITQNNYTVTPRDHLHNEYLDILVKFGLPALVLLFLIYLYFLKYSISIRNYEILIILLMLATSQLTQSQFAHHQAITFFISLLYVNINSVNRNSK